MQPFSNQTSSSTAEFIADSLRADILHGRFKSKQALRQDEIAAAFGVSKIPVREALFQLKAEGLRSAWLDPPAFEQRSLKRELALAPKPDGTGR